MTSFSAADRDVNLMKARAAKNQTFIYVKIPEVPVYFSYKVRDADIFVFEHYAKELVKLFMW